MTHNLRDSIRVDTATQKGSVYDVISVVTQRKGSYTVQVFSRIQDRFPEFIPKCDRFKINGQGHVTPVADAATLVEIAWLCPGDQATEFRRKGAESVCRMLGGDLTLVDEIQQRHAQVSGTAEEEFLLAGTVKKSVQEMPYTLEQLQQMQVAAAGIAASKAEIQQCAIVLHEFPMAKYAQYIELKTQEFELRSKDFGLSEKCFGLKQKQDEHGLRMDRERAELEDRSAKRQRYNADTEDGMTFKTLLAKAAEGAKDAKSFEDQARQLSLGLEVYKAFKQQIRGNHRPLQYSTEAADAIASFIKDFVHSNARNEGKDMRSYYQPASLDTGDLYD